MTDTLYTNPPTSDEPVDFGSVRGLLAAAARLWAAERGVWDESTSGHYSTSGNEFLHAAEAAFWDHAFRAKVHGSPPSSGPSLTPPAMSDALRWEVFERDDFRCLHCGTRRLLTVDHIVPKVAGGSNDLSNLQTLCRSCNSRKGCR